MFWNDDPSSVSQLPTPAAEKLTTPSYFASAPPGSGTPPTLMTPDFANMLLQEGLNLIEAGGLAAAKNVFTQFAQAVGIIGRRLHYVQNSASPYNNQAFVVPAGVYWLTGYIRGPGGPGGVGSSGSNGITSGGAASGGGYLEFSGPVTPGQQIVISIGTSLASGVSQTQTPNNTTISVNGTVYAIAFGANAGGNASGNTPGVSGSSGAAGITEAGGEAGWTGIAHTGGGASFGIYLSGTSAASFSGTAYGTQTGSISSGGANPGEPGSGPGGGGTGGIGLTSGGVAGQPGGLGADGDGLLRY